MNRRELAGVILLGLILTTLLFPLNLTAGDLIQLELFRCPQEPKVGQRLQASLESRGPGETISAWVFFTDKGILGEREYRKAVGERIDELGSRVRIRRLKVRRPEDLVDFADLPVYPPYVQQILDTGVEQRAASRWLNAISVRADGQQIRRLAEFPFVSWLRQVAGGRRHEPEAWENETYELPTEGQFPLDYGPSYTQLKQIAVPQFHSWLEENGLGLPGEGVRICLLDTGFELIHESLQHLDILAQWDFINDDDVVADEDTDPQGQASHGTVVLSVAGGFYPGQLIGPAYGATFLLGKTEDIADEQPIEEDYWVEGVEWGEGWGADVINSSLGYMDWYTYADMDGNTAVTTVAADLAAARGVVVVTAAGNEALSSWKYIIAPADGDQVIAVGAVDTLGIRTYFSSIGPTYDGRIKPDVMACGLDAYAANFYSENGYHRSMGTSVSTPLVCGVVALLLQADSSLVPAQVGDALRTTASRALSPDNNYGWGIVNAEAARRGILPPQPPSVMAVHNFPNPFSESTIILFQVLKPSQAKVVIFTLAGELVRELSQHCAQEDLCECVWDGRNQSGEAVADGVYLYQVNVGNQVMRGKMVRLRGL